LRLNNKKIKNNQNNRECSILKGRRGRTGDNGREGNPGRYGEAGLPGPPGGVVKFFLVFFYFTVCISRVHIYIKCKPPYHI
jgi:hypothetical protein